MGRLRTRAEELLGRWASAELLESDGSLRVAVSRPAVGDRMPAWRGFIAACLAVCSDKAHPLHGSGALIDLARATVRLGWQGISDRHPGAIESSHFTITPLFEAYELIRPMLRPAERDRLDVRFTGFLEKLASALRPRFGARGMNDVDLGTGLNHTVCWAALLCQGAAVLEREEWAKLGVDWAHRVVESQDASGYVSEHVGPSVLYDSLTLEALAKIAFRTGDARVLAGARKLARFLVHCVYPDLRSLETFDERGRGTGLFASHLMGFQMLPEGRRLFERVVEEGWRRLESGSSPGGIAGPVALSLRYFQGEKTAPLPCERPADLFRVGDQALIRRSRPWFCALSAFGNPPPPHNIFFHERTSILSVYHDRVGRVIGGGNDRAPQYAGFCCNEEDWIHYCLPRRGSAKPGRGGDRLQVDYGPADLDLTVTVKGRNELVIELKNELRERRDTCFLNLQLPLAGVGDVVLGTGKAVQLKPLLKLRHHKTGGTLNAGCWRLEGPADSEFVWPHHPYVPYPQRRPSESVGFFRVPLAPVRSAATLRLVVKP